MMIVIRIGRPVAYHISKRVFLGGARNLLMMQINKKLMVKFAVGYVAWDFHKLVFGV
jgi:hypothetical protein